MSNRPDPLDPTRRRVIQAMLAVPALTLAACGGGADAAAQGSPTAPALLTPTPVCDDGDDDPTPAQTEGPYFTSNSPVRTSLVEAGMPGTLLAISGRVLTTACQGIAQAKLDFWQADNAGAYDNAGYRLRGHQFTDGSGNFSLQTIVPGLYPGRTRHIHVKVQAPTAAFSRRSCTFPASRATRAMASTARNCCWRSRMLERGAPGRSTSSWREERGHVQEAFAGGVKTVRCVRFCNTAPAKRAAFGGLAGRYAGTNFALQRIVRARRIGQTRLIFVPLLICGARFHAGALGTPAGVTQEVARCLNMVRVAAARRNGRQTSEPDRRRSDAGRTRKKG